MLLPYSNHSPIIITDYARYLESQIVFLLWQKGGVVLTEDEAKGKEKQEEGKMKKGEGWMKEGEGEAKKAEGKMQEEWGKVKKKV